MRLHGWRVRDEELSQKLVHWGNSRIKRPLAWSIARSGDSVFWLIIIAVLIWRSNALAWDLLWAVIITAVLVTILKGVFRRQRPKEKWAIATDKYSFPSGHAARAAALAVRLAYAWPNFMLIWLLWAISVALARVILSRHYVSDVAGGLVTGILTGLSIQFLI